MMLKSLRSLFATARQPSSHARAVPRRTRPQPERLGDRTLPNAAPIQHLVADIQHDVADVQSDIQAVKTALGATVSSTVTSDLAALTTDVGKVAADLAA